MDVNPPQLDGAARAPLTILRELSKCRQTGEFVCANGGTEVHVYMQHGQIAWGTDSKHPMAFGQRIFETCGIQRDVLVSLVADCRRQRMALGESLVRRGLATYAQVREALRHQAAEAVRALAGTSRGECAFYERESFASYDAALTFSLAELLLEAELPHGGMARADSGAARVQAESPARRVFQELTDCEWSEYREGARLLERYALHPDAGVASSGIVSLLNAGTLDFVGVRAPAGAILGAAMEGGAQSVWCGVNHDAALGAAYALFGRLCGLERRVLASRPLSAERADPVTTGEGGTFAATARALMERAPDVLGVCHLRAGHMTTLVARGDCAADGLPRRAAGAVEHVFDAELLRALRPHSESELRTSVLGDARTWTFGVQISQITEESVWLETSRSTAQGFGWACLTALVRELGAT